MKRNLLLLAFTLLLSNYLYSQIIPKTTKVIPAWQDFLYETFGDNYPSSPRTYSDIGNCLLLEGPGNNNPGNIKDDANPTLPDSLVQYIRRQFQYVIVDQDAFCDRSEPDSDIKTAMFTSAYYTEGKKLITGSNFVLFYFSPSIMDSLYPIRKRGGFDTTWYLHDVNNVRIKAGDEKSWVMDMNNSAWRAFYISYTDSVIRANSTAQGFPHVFIGF